MLLMLYLAGRRNPYPLLKSLEIQKRVMPSCWFLLLRFWLRVDGALMRLRDTRVFCTFNQNSKPLIIREICWRETSFKALASKSIDNETKEKQEESEK
ncbi:unnamed protein product [Lactuca saligna]|uniref:Uncharacterized protein n=1 Tax=Lactuca saligna TaxID=75948 RepID=A0AA36EAD5_LACSI|nr:unnamed protein product [Lactuca saligna]